MEFQLANGLRVVCAHMPYMRSVAVGVFVGVGSRMETERENGISHFIEHMLFKGTKRRSAQEIACEMDAIGGNLNAYTTREYTCFYAKAVQEEIERLFDILSDMCLSSVFAPRDIELERSVILEEINMYEDSPEDVVLEMLSRNAWGENALGRSIAGKTQTVSAITGQEIKGFWETYYQGANTVVSVAGNFDVALVERLAKQYFGGMGTGHCAQYQPAQFDATHATREKDIEQTHYAIAYPGVSQNAPERYSMAVLANAFGGGMSSRLFQKIREEKGLVYSVYAAPDAFRYEGMLMVYAGMSPEHTEQVQTLIQEEVEDVANNGLTHEEVIRGISQLKSGYVMGLESVSGRMQSLGRSILLYGTAKTEEEVLAGIAGVTEDEVRLLAKKVFTADFAEALVCPKK
ncbi:MAG: pitrilysin family protein [Clostridia bacterium]|nr:pitrilysin family protein [Clostridia bacterium]